MLRVLLTISALIAALLIAGAGTAAADDGTGDGTGTGTGTGESGDPPEVSQPPVVGPEPTTATPPSIFDIPRNIANQLRDMLGRPLSIFGNGRTPGTHTLPDGTVTGIDKTSRKRGNDKPPATKVDPAVPDPVVSEPPQDTPPQRRGTSSVDVTLPFSVPPISVVVPGLPIPGYQGTRWQLNLSDPYAAFTSLGQTLSTVNSLLASAYAPFHPAKPLPPPEPEPEPTFRIMEEEPLGPVDAGDAGGVVDATPMADGSDLPVVQAPIVIPPIRLAPTRPITGSVPAAESGPASGTVPSGVGQQAPRVGSAAELVPASRGPGTQTNSIPPERLPPNVPAAPMSNSSLREGYPQYLRSARISQLATVALPGLAGLIAITAGGGVIGYRQANSGRQLRSESERYLQ